MKRCIKDIAKKSLIVAMPTFVVGLLFYSGFYIAYKRGENNGYIKGYQYAASAVDGAVKEHLEARDKLKDALIDVLKYKVELQEKEGCK